MLRLDIIGQIGPTMVPIYFHTSTYAIFFGWGAGRVLLVLVTPQNL